VTIHLTHSEDETQAVARDLATHLTRGDVVRLSGELGAGKTAFVRGVVRGRGVVADEVSSPTFTLIQEYGGGAVYHVDLYRLQPEEVDDLGLEELPESGGLLCIEWADRLPRRFRGAVSVRITDQGRDVREIVITDERQPAPADDHPESSASRT